MKHSPSFTFTASVDACLQTWLRLYDPFIAALSSLLVYFYDYFMSCTINLKIYLSTITKPIIEPMKGIETKTMTAGEKKLQQDKAVPCQARCHRRGHFLCQ